VPPTRACSRRSRATSRSAPGRGNIHAGSTSARICRAPPPARSSASSCASERAGAELVGCAKGRSRIAIPSTRTQQYRAHHQRRQVVVRTALRPWGGEPGDLVHAFAHPQTTDDRSGLLLVLLHRAERCHPRLRRAEPVLLLRHELLALAQDADPHHVGRLLAFAGSGGIDRRAATRAERLQARIAALGCGLEVAGRLSGHPEARTWYRHRDAERRAGAGLAIRAMADRGFL